LSFNAVAPQNKYINLKKHSLFCSICGLQQSSLFNNPGGMTMTGEMKNTFFNKYPAVYFKNSFDSHESKSFSGAINHFRALPPTALSKFKCWMFSLYSHSISNGAQRKGENVRHIKPISA
jgi:hypothetical protein